MRAIAPKSNATCLIGRKVLGVSPIWYINGGTFCCRCSVAYSKVESYKIYLRDKEMGRKHLIPKCPTCGQSLRTRSKSNPFTGFWDYVKETQVEAQEKRVA